MTLPIARRAPGRIVIERVVVHGVPASGLDPAAVSAAIHETLPRLLSHGMHGLRPAGRHHVSTRRATWSPAAGPDAVGRAVADSVAGAVGGSA